MVEFQPPLLPPVVEAVPAAILVLVLVLGHRHRRRHRQLRRRPVPGSTL